MRKDRNFTSVLNSALDNVTITSNKVWWIYLWFSLGYKPKDLISIMLNYKLNNIGEKTRKFIEEYKTYKA